MGRNAAHPNRPTLTYRQIADDLETRILTGEFRPGWPIPQLVQLGEAYGVSVSTAQRAVMLLRDRRLVLGVPGRGVFVRADLHTTAQGSTPGDKAGGKTPPSTPRRAHRPRS